MLRIFVILLRGTFLLIIKLFQTLAYFISAAAKWSGRLHAKAQTMDRPRRYFWVRFGPAFALATLLLAWPIIVASTTTHLAVTNTPVAGQDVPEVQASDIPSSPAVGSSSPPPTTDPAATSAPVPSVDPLSGNSAGGDLVPAAGVILPNSARTPGATNSAVSQETIIQTICTVGWTTTIRPPSSVTTAVKLKQLSSGYAHNGDTATSDCEEDHLISLELGGAPSAEANLWPEPYNVNAGARVKDQIEDKLHTMVCAGAMTLVTAQTAIATNWWAAYQTYIGTAAGLAPAPEPAPVSSASNPAPVPPAPPATRTVYAGAFCSVAGAAGVTSTGKAMVCKTTSTDSRLRWRAA
jgi:hypothetical protein